MNRSKSGAAEQVRRPPDQCFDLDSIADPMLAGENPAYRLYRFMPARTLRYKRKRLEAAETRERACFERGGHTFSAGVAWNTMRLNTKQNFNRLACVASSRHSKGA